MLDQLRSSRAYERVKRHEVVHQFIKYALVGVVNVALYFAVFNVLLLANTPVLAANALAFFLTSINSFVLNKRWAFRDPRREGVVRRYLVFVFFTLVGLGIQTSAFSLFHIYLRRYGTLGANLSALCALPFSIVWNFTSYRLWTFRSPDGRSVEA